MIRFAVAVLIWGAVLAPSLFGQEKLPAPRVVGYYPKPFVLHLPPELKDYRTPETAIAAKVAAIDPNKTGQTGFLGIYLEKKGPAVAVGAVQPGSPAAGKIEAGDILQSVDGRKLDSIEEFREALQSHEPGQTIKLGLLRAGKPVDTSATLGATSKPMKPDAPQPTLAIRVVEGDDGTGVVVEGVTQAGTAERAGVKVGDIIVKLDGVAVTHPQQFSDLQNAKKPNDTVTLTVKRNGQPQDIKVVVDNGNVQRGGGGGPGGRRGGWDDRISRTWQKPSFRLAIVGVEYPDAKHNDKIKLEDWQRSFFSIEKYTTTNATGQKVFGSVADYYFEQSFGKLGVTGKVFDWIEMPKKRMEYGGSTAVNSKTDYLTEATNRLLAREGKDALKDFDGIFFVYAGQRATDNRATLYWPHRANYRYEGKSWPYFIINEMSTASRMTDISVMCHEFGHMLGLPDLYARPENPGSEGVGVWCAMSNQLGGGRPQHFSAWCKEQLNWVQPTVIDPTVKQKLVLAPVEEDPKQCFKVLVRPDGSEYYLLENRKREGFDGNLPAEGLLVWRIVRGQPILEESHGILGPTGPRVFLGSVPFPSPSNNSFTPYTTPSSRSQLGGGNPVHITNITRHAGGLISFWIGYEFE